ncbi:unnamed protein product [Discosporangium mesarthrocarpum]
MMAPVCSVAADSATAEEIKAARYREKETAAARKAAAAVARREARAMKAPRRTLGGGGGSRSGSEITAVAAPASPLALSVRAASEAGSKRGIMSRIRKAILGEKGLRYGEAPRGSGSGFSGYDYSDGYGGSHRASMTGEHQHPGAVPIGNGGDVSPPQPSTSTDRDSSKGHRRGATSKLMGSRGQSWARGLLPLGNHGDSSSDDEEAAYCWSKQRGDMERRSASVHREEVKDAAEVEKDDERFRHLFKMNQVHGHRISGASSLSTSSSQ